MRERSKSDFIPACAVATIVALIPLHVSAQDTVPTFTTGTRLVIVDLSARDKSGAPITNLKREDVEVFEDGVRQEMQSSSCRSSKASRSRRFRSKKPKS